MKFHLMSLGKVLGVLMALLLVPNLSAAAEPGVSANSIKIGWIGGVSGPIAFVAQNARIGMETYFKYVNDSGGINGRKIQLLSEDDGYQPVRTLAAYKKLKERDDVFAFCGNMGTVTTASLVSILEEDKIPLVAPFGLSLSVTVPPKRYLFGIFGNYYDQMETLGQYIVKSLKKTKISYLYQNDEAGQDGLKGLTAALERDKLSLVQGVPFATGTQDFSAPVLKAKGGDPEVVVLLTVPVNSARIMKEIAKFGWKPLILGHAPIVDEQLVEMAGDAAEGVRAAGLTVLHNSDTEVVKTYRERLAKYFPGTRPTFWSLQAYVAGMVCAEGLKRAGENLTREGLVNALETLKNFETGIVGPITFGPNVRAGNRSVAIMEVKNRSFVQITGWVSPSK